jgi:hypothetical protein
MDTFHSLELFCVSAGQTGGYLMGLSQTPKRGEFDAPGIFTKEVGNESFLEAKRHQSSQSGANQNVCSL